ncbi:MAG: hypothetical protein ACM3Q1_02740 [Bacteroidales bacterium]
MEKRLLARWLVSCILDYTLLAAAILFFALYWPAGQEPLRAVLLILLVQLLYQPLGEAVGGTIGQRLSGIRLTAPAPASALAITTIIRRHGERIGVLWGLLSAYLYWRTRLGPRDTRPPIPTQSPGDWEWIGRSP